MSTLNFLFLGFLFLLVASLVYLALNQWTSDDFEKRRLGLVQPSRPAEHAWLKRMQSKMMALLLRMSPWAGTAAPEDVLQPSALQMRLLNAGIRSGLAVPVFLGLKTFLTFFLPACFVMLTWLLQLSWSELMFWTGVMAAAALGYYSQCGFAPAGQEAAKDLVSCRAGCTGFDAFVRAGRLGLGCRH
jgi:tight adherence protein C